MASLTCPNCGKDNPDFLDDCQFCQAPLRREATLNIGEGPTKKDTGELEGVLPDWLKEARQQARDSAEEEAGVPPSMPKVQKDEPQDLLAGLAFQAAADEEEVPDWLSAISPIKEEKTSGPAEEETPSDFFAQFDQPAKPVESEPAPEESQAEGLPWLADATTPAQEPEPFAFDQGAPADENAWLGDLSAPASQPAASEPEDLGWLRDLEASSKAPEPAAPQADSDWISNLDSATGSQEDMSWLNNLGGAPAEPAPASPSENLDWLNNLGGLPLDSKPAPVQPAAPKEDLSWLGNLGESEPAEPAPASQPEDLSWLNKLGGTPAEPTPTSQPEDLSWLDTLGGTPAPTFEEPVASHPESTPEDLDWLKDLGGTPAPSFEEPVASQPESQPEDLGWLNSLGAIPAETAPPGPSSTSEDLSWLDEMAGTATPADLGASQTGLDWLDNLGGTPAPAEPASSQEDLSWLDTFGGTPAPESLDTAQGEPTAEPFQTDVPDWLKTVESHLDVPAKPLSPAHTAPLSPEAAANIPDWLREATEAASLPPLSAAPAPKKEEPVDELMQGFDEVPGGPAGLPTFDQTQPEAGPSTHDLFPALADSATTSDQDVDALFNVDMPDWLTQQPETPGEPSASGGIPAGMDASLSPADLPSWVQAMRPVESVVSETASISADQNTERQGPLAGFRGVIPAFPIGSSQRPKAISLKLQATDEQQAGAALIEQIITGEAQPRSVKAATLVASQRALRWALTALFLLVLGTVIGLGTKSMPVAVSNSQMAEIQNLSSAILGLPDGAPVLVVMDYEPALAGEMESAAGPLLDQLTLLRQPTFTFVSTSSNGTALVERLLKNTGINQPTENGGLGYQADVQYFNIGYLPGGSAGVRGFVENPQNVMPAARVNLFSDFAAVILLTDHAESGLVWIEQVELAKQTDPALVNKPVLVAASAQAGPLLQPYVSSRQVTGMISGLADAARYEFTNNSRLGMARSYWDAFGAGLFLAVVAIVLGSLWSLISTMRARRATAEGE